MHKIPIAVLTAIAALMLPGAAFAATFDAVQHKSASGSSTAPALTLTSAPTQGDLVVLGVSANQSSAITCPSGYTALTSIAVGSPARTQRLCYKVAGASESATLTASLTTSQPWVAEAAEYNTAGVTVNAPTENAQSDAAATAITTPSVTPTSGLNGLAVGFTGQNSGGTWSSEQVNSSATGVTTEETKAQNSAVSAALFDKVIASTSGTYDAQATSSVSAAGVGSIAVFTTPGTAGTASCANTGVVWCGDFSSGTFTGTQTQYNGGNNACTNAQTAPDEFWYDSTSQNPSTPAVIKASPVLLNSAATFTMQFQLPHGQGNNGTGDSRCQLDKNGWTSSSESSAGKGEYFHYGIYIHHQTDSHTTDANTTNPWRANVAFPSTNDGQCSFGKMGYEPTAGDGTDDAHNSGTPGFVFYGDQGSCGTDHGIWKVASPTTDSWYEFIVHIRFSDCTVVSGTQQCGLTTTAPQACPASSTNSTTQDVNPYENNQTGYMEVWEKAPGSGSYQKLAINDAYSGYSSFETGNYTVCGHTMYTQNTPGSTEQNNLRVGDYRDPGWPNTDYIDFGQVYASSTLAGAGY